MAQNVDKFEFEVTGETALEAAIATLEQFEDSEFNNVHINLRSVSTESDSHQTETRQAGLAEASETEANQPGKVKSGTSHAKVLSALSQHDGPIPTKRVLSDLDMPEGTVYAAMSDLHDRGLVERTDERSFNNSYGYTVSEAGEREISRLREVE